MRPLIKPQLSLNGTSKKQLLEQQIKVLEAMRDLRGAMSEAMPHGRDYQFRPAEYQQARDAWLERMKAIEAVSDEIEQHAWEISDA